MKYLTKSGNEITISIVEVFALSKAMLRGSYITAETIRENIKYVFSKKGAYNILLDATLISFSDDEKEAYERMLKFHLLQKKK